MRVVLEIQTGPNAGTTIQVEPDQVVRVGRTDRADVVLAHDGRISSVHFALECRHDQCLIRDLNSTNGTFVNGERINETALRDGDEVTAGKTTFAVRVEVEPAGATEVPSAHDARTEEEEEAAPAVAHLFASVPTPGTPQDRLLEVLRGQPEPLYAILDAARDPSVLALLLHCDDEYASLYEGAKGEQLAAVAPYLVRLAPSSALLATLVEQGRGNSWGVYLTCDKPFKEVRKHFRRFLLVETDAGKKVYFRFYDPRVLRVFLPTCLPEETHAFFGPVLSFLVEDDDAERLLRWKSSEGPIKEVIPLSVATETLRL